ncbi:restriction system modified-DNA reader domain-containing protein [Actinokineospora sp. NPDC004072]
MSSHPTTTPALRDVLPPETVLLAPAPTHTVPTRPPTGAWGLVVVAVRTTDAAAPPVRFIGDAPAPDPAPTDIADLFAGTWLPAPPPAHLHSGDVVLRLLAPTDDDPTRVDVEVLAAIQGKWHTVLVYQALDTRWPHEVVTSVLLRMRVLADAALSDAQWTTLTGKPASGGEPNTLAALLDAGLIEQGEPVLLGAHRATVVAGGILQHGPDRFAVSTVNALATTLTGTTANGWHLWRRAHDDRLLADLRTDLATR